MPDGQSIFLPWTPQLGPQFDAIDAAWCEELLFGGARGGGKSDFLLGDYMADAKEYREHWRGILFRQTYPQLDDLIGRSHQIVPATFPGSVWHEQKRTWTLPTGSTLKMRVLERVQDAANYQGHQYCWVGWDELGNWPNLDGYKMMIACLRNGNVPVVRKRIRASANPGGPGHQAVKARFIDPAPGGYTPITDAETGMVRMFIPSRLPDNRILIANDPGYEARLHNVGSKELVRAWLDGDWSVVTGAFFDNWSSPKHVIEPFAIPAHWTRFCSFDWGSAKPFAVGWYAISDGSLLPGGKRYPTGAMVMYRSWYGASGPNVGLKMTTEAVAQGIAMREGNETISYRVADPACWQIDGGPSHAERMYNAARLLFRQADNSRVAGWDQVRTRLDGDGERPMLYVFKTCVDMIRTLPALLHDDKKAEDVNCLVAGTMISTPQGDIPIENIAIGDFVNTPIGPQKVIGLHCAITDITVRVTFNDGRELEGTERHKVYGCGVGLVELKSLDYHVALMEKNTWSRPLNIMASFIVVMRDAFITIQAAPFFLAKKARVFIANFGLILERIFLQDFMSTIKMVITTTTIFQTSNALRGASIRLCTLKKGSHQETSKKFLANGGNLLREKPNLNLMQKRCSLLSKRENYRAIIVRILLLQDRLQQNSVLQNANRAMQMLFAKYVAPIFDVKNIRRGKLGPVHIVAVGRLEGAKKVYDLTVEGAHLYYANGVLSSNSDMEDHDPDQLRYACMSRPITKHAPTTFPLRGAAEMTMDEAWSKLSPKPNQRQRI